MAIDPRPVPFVITVSGDADDAPDGTQHIALYGDSPATSVSVEADATNGIVAGSVQEVLSALAARIKDLEGA